MYFQDGQNKEITLIDSNILVTEKDEKVSTGRATPNEKLKQKEKISRYGSFYLRLGAIGKFIQNGFSTPLFISIPQLNYLNIFIII